jgi:hypothetical protein
MRRNDVNPAGTIAVGPELGDAVTASLVTIDQAREALAIKEIAPEQYAATKAGRRVKQALKEASLRRKCAGCMPTRLVAVTAAELSVVTVPEALQRQSRDWWQLGEHLLYCGDSSSEAFVSRASAVSARFAFADPAYSAEVDHWDSGFVWRHDWIIDAAALVAVTPGVPNTHQFGAMTTMPIRWAICCYLPNSTTRSALGLSNWIHGLLFSHTRVYRNSRDVIQVQPGAYPGTDLLHEGRLPLELLRLIDGWVGTQVERNAMTSPQLIAFLESKHRAAGVGKVVLDAATLEIAYRRAWHYAPVRAALERATRASASAELTIPVDLAAWVEGELTGTNQAWDDVVWERARRDRQAILKVGEGRA